MGYAYLLGAAFFFSLMTVCVKLAGSRLPAEEIILARSVLGLVLSIWVVRRAGLPLRGNARGLLLLRGVLGSCGLYCFFHAVTVLPLSEVTTIHYVNPILTALLAAVVLQERVGWGLAAALAVSLSGVVVVARPQMLFGGAQVLDSVAVGIALAGACFSAGAYVTVRRLRATDDPLVVVLWFPIVAAPVFLPLALRVWVWPRPLEWLVLLGVGVSTQIAQVFLTRGLHLLPAGRGTTVGYVQIAFAMVWSVLLFGERVDAVELGGAALVVLGIVVLVVTRPRE
ncbi:DMT family transporter [Paraliomyxa miuraensis]|uniref:DMT family transporter n=1 Tax=Paraliomyxa miuraensis TaxID=376150 RepID=UPI0022555827|nr:DMT family transporter [Paraliomyxa miuraensis]MCX4246420.1 DMT family transporter [Paraliomyxa miuraensis]